MKSIDMEKWNRKNHYNYFKQLDYPHFNICGNIDITSFHGYIKENELPFFISFLYAVMKTANNIPEFRYRIREDRVIEHASVNPSFTLMTEQELFSFCTVKFTDIYNNFRSNALDEINNTKNSVNLEDEPGRDDLIFITSIPWVSFTNITHPIHMNPVDSIPRISWGKYFIEGGKVKIPLSLQAHHALVDGIHFGRFFNIFQEMMDDPVNYYNHIKQG